MPRKPNRSGACGLWWTVTTSQPRMIGNLGPHPDSSPHMDLTRQVAGSTLYTWDRWITAGENLKSGVGRSTHLRKPCSWGHHGQGTAWLGNIMLMGHLARRQHAHGTPWSGNTMDVGHHSTGMPCSTRVFTAQQPLTGSLLPPHQTRTPVCSVPLKVHRGNA